MKFISVFFQLVGSLGFLLFGMKMMSEGMQKSAGERLERTLSFMTKNRIFSVFTGMIVTMIIQSSSATTVMVVSFVNAGLLSLQQSIGVIFGANIGTTVTAWIVSLVGFNFKISAIAVPMFGIGYALAMINKLNKKGLGEALMGFGLLFMGLSLLSSAVPKINADNVSFLTSFIDKGALSIAIGIIAGIVITVIIHSSSAATAIILTMSHNGLLTWEFAAAMVLGSNIGTTIDAVLASIGTKTNARRAAFVHVMFNVGGTFLAVIFFQPLLLLVDIIVPGDVTSQITTHIAMLHTVFNVTNTIVFLPFTKQIALLAEKIIKQKEQKSSDEYHLEYNSLGKENPVASIVRAEKEIFDFCNIAITMFDMIQMGIKDRSQRFIDNDIVFIYNKKEYTSSMHIQIVQYLEHCQKLPVSDGQQRNIYNMIQVVDELETMTENCQKIGKFLLKSIEAKIQFPQDDMERLIPYVELVREFLHFIQININKHLDDEKRSFASELENQIDAFRKNLKKLARKRLEEGANVKSELLYIDIVRRIEKIGDSAFSISEALSHTV